jgi:adenylate cyclase
MFLWVEGRAHFALGDYPNAIRALAESVRVRPNYWFTQAYLTAYYALVGRQPEARKTLVPFTKNFPQYNLARITEHYKEEQYQNPTQEAASAQLLSGLRKAGLK